jgi:hypothetical protein
LPIHRLGQALLSIRRKIGHVTDFPKCLGKILSGIAIVFDDQETHDAPAILYLAERQTRPPLAAYFRSAGDKAESESTYHRKVLSVRDFCHLTIWKNSGGRKSPSPWFEPPAGATDAGGTSHFADSCDFEALASPEA